MIILDFETNSANIHDVIEVAAFRIKREEGMYVITDIFHRYYFSEYEVNPYALAVHKLSPQRIERLRANVDYSEYFVEDQAFVNFCKGSKTLVAHNVTFELRHLGDLVSFDHHICTMKENKKIVKALNIRGNLKNPKLLETCKFYNIEFDEEQYHSALYDVTKTLEVLNMMSFIAPK
ncbi:MAG TPA: 3'-5' exonuclease [Sulfuricurvum sp.]|nr:MAG: DNA polymerase III subunit epsilon [Campylobacterales bacterium 16-40-21]OZA02090.1 MAG: DNA polymerase III subunit epsilon [Sulfuricurvum sp. 17-40-25]HQS67751.1 3'-5' exonuclease [Sulfuricurvum sp.]HQT37462.1 3'-5' exonuclease [Sulfuricurvum sp.]